MFINSLHVCIKHFVHCLKAKQQASEIEKL